MNAMEGRQTIPYWPNTTGFSAQLANTGLGRGLAESKRAVSTRLQAAKITLTDKVTRITY